MTDTDNIRKSFELWAKKELTVNQDFSWSECWSMYKSESTNDLFEAYLQGQRDLIEAMGEPVGFLLNTGHGVVLKEVKPKCEIDYWQPLYKLRRERNDIF